MGHFSEQNFYEILEVGADATSEEIQKAFYRAKSTYSPSSPALYSVFSEEEAKELLRLIDEAYSVLSNHSKRRDYDKRLFGKERLGGTNENIGQIVPFPGTSDVSADLPDFMLPESRPRQETTQPQKKEIKATSADFSSSITEKRGYGKTIISHYDVDPVIEKEIATQDHWDGAFIQRVRLYKNISLDQLSETSRINKPYLLSIETNDFHALPAPVYVRGFIQTIARLLGLPEKKSVESFLKLLKDSRGK